MRNMKYLTLMALVGLIVVGVFGFVGMNHEMDHESGNCVASVLNIAVCPSETISSALYHIAAYKSFSQMTLVSLSLLITLLLALLFFIAVRSVRGALAPIPIALSPQAVRRRNTHRASGVEFTRWLSRFENSPSVRCSA